MKLVRFGEKGEECPGVWMGDGRILDVRALAFHIEDYNEHFFTHHGIRQLEQLLKDPGASFVEASTVRLGVPVARPSKIICVGANYADHAREFGHKIPEEPILFSKVTSALNGPNDPIRIPDGARVMDGEAELAVVIGKTAFGIREADALDYVAGYTLMNDVTERVVQKKNGQWMRGKGFDSFAPLGPFLITPDELPDPGNMTVWQTCNGRELQRANTVDMMFDVPFLIEFISRGMTLNPGDIIATGTPSGIGSARDPQVLLKSGDVVEIGVDGIGVQRNEVVSA
ncbi:fumarylacetoacetate hydrolase family protein [Pontiella agarivorans]|uniref:Fumarylacetoacetate hydrolase family protein n=1 Tax=Pontiella agarivorans TaxID=3038953 RepID=A0ABU5N005_9BACT|nr:fumarylacetoacetate hydrolase family protein [Pontiella agarivorans]MDZ8119782.1 fumarylacetoacetate hydrolase family protein [Pontiella agarivorans]